MKKLIYVLTVAALAGAYGCGGKAPGEQAGQAPDEAAEQAAGGAGRGEHEEDHGDGAVKVSPEAQRAGGIRTLTLRRAAVAETFQAMGRVLQDAQRPHHLTAPAAGRLESLHAALGQAVDAGAVVAVVRGPAGQALNAAATHKGLVTAVHAAEGDAVNEMSFLVTVTEVDPLWGVLDIPERSLAEVRPGQRAEIRAAAYPRAVFSGTIASISPEIDNLSRTVKARVSIANPDGLLKFGMFIDAAVRTGSFFQGVAVPAGAVQNGPAGPFVFVQRDADCFVPRPVETGREKDGLVEIKRGLAAGEKVVVDGAFLLKSEMMKAELGED